MKKGRIIATFVVIVTMMFVSIISNVSNDSAINPTDEAICVEKYTGETKIVSSFAMNRDKFNHYSLYIPVKMSRVINEKYPKEFYRDVEEFDEEDSLEEYIEVIL